MGSETWLRVTTGPRTRRNHGRNGVAPNSSATVLWRKIRA